MTEIEKIEELISGKPPEKIYHWLQTQLSVARFYGGMKFQGYHYKIDYTDPQNPLVRADVMQAELKASKTKKKEHDDIGKARWTQLQI